jgi:protein-S-isoprenylcysteine O-methyltransferase Ste14
MFLLLAPGVVGGVVPWWITRWVVQPPLLRVSTIRILGILLVLEGVAVVLDSFARFAFEGKGTPAPIYPTQKLIVSGLYRYVRNPMYVCVLLVIFGQGLFFGDVRVLIYGAIAWLITHLFVLWNEEPTLRRMFGEEYLNFTANVPRWIPRLRPWPGK